MNIGQYFKDKKGITIDASFTYGMRYTSIDLCRFAKKYSEKKDKKYIEMLEALKWFVNSMNHGSLIIFTDDDQHKAVRDSNQDMINKIELLVKELES